MYANRVVACRSGCCGDDQQLSDNVLGLLALTLNLVGLDHLTSMSAAASAIANVGPGLGNIVGPAETYGRLPDVAKWVLSFGMLLGRLELLTVLVLFSPMFWRT